MDELYAMTLAYYLSSSFGSMGMVNTRLNFMTPRFVCLSSFSLRPDPFSICARNVHITTDFIRQANFASGTLKCGALWYSHMHQEIRLEHHFIFFSFPQKKFPLTYSCAFSLFNYNTSGHVITGDLNIIENELLCKVVFENPNIIQLQCLN